MSYSISDLMIRNLRDVFGENDPARRRAAIDELWAEDGVFYDPSKGAIRGREEIDRVAGAVKATHPDFRYQSNFGRSMLPQSYVEAYIGKQGATVPSVRMMTLFWPARQFQSAKRSSPLSSWTIPGIEASNSA